jgi:hypothetical protein
MHITGRRYLAPGLAVALALGLPSAVAAHDVTGGEREPDYSDNEVVGFRFGSPGGPAWFQSAVEVGAETDWDTDNNTRAPDFVLGTSGPAVRYGLISENPFPSADECPSDQLYFACTDYIRDVNNKPTIWRYTFFNSEQGIGLDLNNHNTWRWCQDPAQVEADCIDVRRLTLHELGHGVGLARGENNHPHQPNYPLAIATTTVLQSYGLRHDDVGYNRRIFGTCDLFELSREYDVNSYYQSLPACTDHLPNNDAFSSGKVKTRAYQSNSPVYLCPGDSYILQGTLTFVNQSADSELGLLGGNPLSGREVQIFRRLQGSTWPGTPYATTIVVAGSAGNWSKSVSGSGTMEFKARYSPVAGTPDDNLLLDESYIRPITWAFPC